jgi:hypothetical protein
MYGPPGTGKTLLARACAAQTDATFLKLAGPQLVQMFIGDGAKLVRDCFALAKEKAPAIIFIDELDAVGTKRFDSEKSGDREVQRTMLELLNQLDGFASDDRIKVLAATNRVDVLDPALLRSGRLDRKIEFPLPNEEARAQILKIHSRKMTVDDAVNWPELARSTDEFGGAQLKAVCVEAGMIALRMGKNKISHEHYVDAIAEVQAKKKGVFFQSLLLLPFLLPSISTNENQTRSTFMHRFGTCSWGVWHGQHNEPCIIENSWMIFSTRTRSTFALLPSPISCLGCGFTLLKMDVRKDYEVAKMKISRHPYPSFVKMPKDETILSLEINSFGPKSPMRPRATSNADLLSHISSPPQSCLIFPSSSRITDSQPPIFIHLQAPVYKISRINEYTPPMEYNNPH